MIPTRVTDLVTRVLDAAGGAGLGPLLEQTATLPCFSSHAVKLSLQASAFRVVDARSLSTAAQSTDWVLQLKAACTEDCVMTLQ